MYIVTKRRDGSLDKAAKRLGIDWVGFGKAVNNVIPRSAYEGTAFLSRTGLLDLGGGGYS